jgi:hypothetical protein
MVLDVQVHGRMRPLLKFGEGVPWGSTAAVGDEGSGWWFLGVVVRVIGWWGNGYENGVEIGGREQQKGL